jgi:hypothetical protein
MNTSSEGATWWQAALMICGQTKAEQRNLRSVWRWSLVWALSFLAVTASREMLHLSGSLAWLASSLPAALSIPVVIANVRFIREADEFMRKVQLHGIAIGFAAGFVFCMGYYSLEMLGAPSLPIVFAAVPLALGWAIGSFIVAYQHR